MNLYIRSFRPCSGVSELNCTIRRAVPEDAAPLAELAARIFRDTFGAYTTPKDMAAHLAASYSPALQLAEIESPEIVTIFAFCDGPAAFAQLRRGTPPACVTTERPVEVWRFYVDQAWHGRGVARKLMQAALDEAAGATAVWLGVWEHNARAIAFYSKLGFVDVGSHDFLLGGDLQTDKVMVRESGG